MSLELLDLVRGRTFDDFLLTPQQGVVPSRDPAAIDLTSRVSERITLKRPLVSANMDTVTRAAMAVALAEAGGLGIIDRGFRAGDIEPQMTEVAAVKRRQHGIIADPHTIAPDRTVADARAVMEQTRVGTLVVVDDARQLRGLLTERDIRFVGAGESVGARMTPRDRLVVETGPMSLDAAERVMAARKIKKLPLVGADGTLFGLITAKDVITHRQQPFATRDGHGRLRVGAAIGATGDYLERAAELARAGADLLVVDIAHGHSVVMATALEALRRDHPNAEIIAGNVATEEGVRFLVERGVNGIKVGIGPGGGCTTRVTTNVGVPQGEALVRCRIAAGDRVPLIADGGIRRDGAIALALLFGGDCVMLGSALAGTTETPGEIVLKPVLMPESQKVVQVPFKVFRGMASIGAVRDRLDLEDASARELEAIGAEGLEVSVPARGSVRPVLQNMLKHLCSTVSYGGARSLAELREKFHADPARYLITLSAAAKAESFDR